MRLADAYEAFLIDLDGVVWRGDDPIPGAAETIAILRNEGKRIAFVTNNASRSPRDFALKLMRHRIPCEPGEVVTSAHAIVEHLRSVGIEHGSRLHVCGSPGLAQVMKTRGYAPTRDTHDVDAVVVGWNAKLTYDDIKLAADVARTGVTFVASNRDATYPSEHGLIPGTGAIVAAIEAASGREATIVGKPEPQLFTYALTMLGVPAERALVCGDRLDTDVVGARAAGAACALFLTGVAKLEDLGSGNPRPDFVLDSIEDLVRDGGVRAPSATEAGAAARRSAPAAEGDDEQEPGHEAADVREEGDAALLHPAETGQPSEELPDEPQAEADPGRRADGPEEDAQWEQRDDGGGWEEHDVSAEDTGDGSRRTDRWDVGGGVEGDVGERGGEPGDEVEDREADVAEPVFDVVPEDPQEEHVEAEMQQIGVDEHRREDGEEPGTLTELRLDGIR